MTVVALAVIVAIGAWFMARWFGRGKPCPASLAALFDNRIAARLSGTATLIRRAGISEGMRVLDAGCGPGRLTIPLGRQVGPAGEVVALDMQQEMLGRVMKNATRAGITNIRTLLGALAFETAALRGYDQTFDRILLVTVLGEIPDREGALRSLYDSLKPGGILSVTEMILDPDYVSRNAVVRMATGAGLKLVRSWGSPVMFTANFQRPDSSPAGQNA